MTAVGFVFPGQGSQEVGMLRDFLERETVVQSCFAEAEDALGIRLRDVVLNGPDGELNRTEITQPALLAASVALWRCWVARGGVRPSIMAGHSLGEYSALVAAGAIEFGAAIRLVNLRGRLMQSAVPPGAGAMAAILGLDEAEVAQCCAAAAGVVTPANINAPGQIVIAGSATAVDVAIEGCIAAGAKRAIKLAVSVPSHCPLMVPASVAFGEALAAVAVSAPSVPVVQNVDATASSDPDQIRRNLIAQLSNPVQWTRCVEAMISRGASTFVECGPGKVLGALIKRIKRTAVPVAIGTIDAFEAALSEVGSG